MHIYKSLTDNDLYCLMQDGDRRAFEEIYARFNGLLYVYACKLIQDRDEAQDVVQEIFVYLWSHPEIEIQSQLSAYLYTAVRYKIFDCIDKNKTRNNYLSSLADFTERGHCITDHQVREKELALLIEKEINLLPPKMRQIFLMSRQEHLSQKEIATLLQLSDKTVKKQIGNAVRLLRLKLTSLLVLVLVLLQY